jgi:hypothetical protein
MNIGFNLVSAILITLLLSELYYLIKHIRHIIMFYKLKNYAKAELNKILIKPIKRRKNAKR